MLVATDIIEAHSRADAIIRVVLYAQKAVIIVGSHYGFSETGFRLETRVSCGLRLEGRNITNRVVPPTRMHGS